MLPSGMFFRRPGGRTFAFLAGVILLLFLHKSKAVGTWASLANSPPLGVNHAMVLSDGTIYTDNGGGQCCRLTPDIHGNYQNGTWSHLSTMNYSRLFFASSALTNGNIFVAGGEYGTGRRHGELFDPLNNAWTKIPDPLPGPAFSDAIGKILPNGNVLTAPVSEFGGCLIYNAAGNSWQTAAPAKNQNEVCWVKLANDCVLTIDTGAQTCEHYVPSLNEWVIDPNVPVVVYDSNAELGPGFLLPNGNVFFLGGTTNTVIYTPGATPTSAGSWIAGPTMVFGTNFLGAPDAPAAMMVNGKIICTLGPVVGFSGSTRFYEYDYVSNAFTAVSAPGGGSTYGASAPFGTSMLALPDGTILFIGGQNSQSLYVYTPDGTPLAQGQPAIYSITENTDGSYLLTGTNLTGISSGAAYGDDEQMDSNYPLVRMTNSTSGDVYYARTFNWNSTSVQTGSRVVTTEFTLPQSLPAGSYSLVVEANGNPSPPTNFTYSPLPAPTGLSAAGGNNGFVPLIWNAVANATAYNVKRSDRSTGYFTTIATISGLTYTNTGLTNGLTYYYKVAAVGSGGPGSDSLAAVSATPAGPSRVPGSTSVNLAALYNRAGIYTDGRTFSGGLDGGGYSFSANLLGTAMFWNNLVFTFGPANASDAVSCAGQVIGLPAGRFTTLQFLATAINGNQAGQNFTVTYTDNSTTTFTQSVSDWANQQSYAGESELLTMSYRDQGSGGSQTLNVSVDGYVLTLNQTKTVKSITLPSDGNLMLFAMALANDPAPAPLAAYYNRAGIYTDGTTFTNPATGGLDGDGNSYSGTLLGSSQTWNGTLFDFGPLNTTNVIDCVGQTISLPAGNYSKLQMLATGLNGNQPSLSFVVTYTDLTTAAFVQGLSDWFTPQNYVGEVKAIPMGYRNSSAGSSSENNSLYLYGYSFALNSARTLQSIRLPNDTNVVVTAISGVPNWPPTFSASAYTLASVNAGTSYSGSIAADASDLDGDTVTFAKVSGPAWLTVASNGALSGTPANSDANTNTFVVSATDPGGMSNTATLNIYVNGAPSFIANPFSLPGVNAGQSYSGTIATNAADPNPGDALTFALVSGPAWLGVAPDGTLSGTPDDSDANTNTFVVSVTDSGGLSNTATLYIYVNIAPYFILNPFSLPGIVAGQNYSGTIATNAADPNPTNSLTFAMVSGPGWLTIATNGAVAGTPLSPSVGTNTFVVSVIDSASLSNTATMYIAVQAAPPIAPSLVFQPGQSLMLTWTGGIGPYQVQQATNLANPDWQNFGAPISSNSILLVPANPAAFYKILGN
jgi:Putative Ig domain/Galactose oxidase, central domain